MKNPQILGAVGVRGRFFKIKGLWFAKEQQIPTSGFALLGMTTRKRVGEIGVFPKPGVTSKSAAFEQRRANADGGMGALGAADGKIRFLCIVGRDRIGEMVRRKM